VPSWSPAGCIGKHLIFLELSLDPDAELKPGIQLKAQIGHVLYRSSQEDDSEGCSKLLRGGERQSDKNVRQIFNPEAYACAAMSIITLKITLYCINFLSKQPTVTSPE
jgi:hypothetical protein